MQRVEAADAHRTGIECHVGAVGLTIDVAEEIADPASDMESVLDAGPQHIRMMVGGVVHICRVGREPGSVSGLALARSGTQDAAIANRRTVLS